MIQIFQPLSEMLRKGMLWSNGRENVEIISVTDYNITTEIIGGDGERRYETRTDGQQIIYFLVSSRGTANREMTLMKLEDFKRAYTPVGGKL